MPTTPTIVKEEMMVCNQSNVNIVTGMGRSGPAVQTYDSMEDLPPAPCPYALIPQPNKRPGDFGLSPYSGGRKYGNTVV